MQTVGALSRLVVELGYVSGLRSLHLPKFYMYSLLTFVAVVVGLTSCGRLAEDDLYQAARNRMTVNQIEARGVRDICVLEAMRRVPRHAFSPLQLQRLAYADRSLDIGYGQTLTQPYMVAFVAELIEPSHDMKVLEIGTGSGYQAAVLAECTREVYSVEIVPQLAQRAKDTLARLKYSDRVQTRLADGYNGWPEKAPFDAIVVVAAAPRVPQPLIDQLTDGGRLIVPVGEPNKPQQLKVITRQRDNFLEKTVKTVAYVPFTGEVQQTH